MSQFIESVCFYGTYRNLSYHQSRIDKTFGEYFPWEDPLRISKVLPQLSVAGKHKVRIVYDDLGHKIEVAAYESKPLNTMCMVVDNSIEYALKSTDRRRLSQLREQAGTDDVIIIKNGFVTDGWISNLAFWDGEQWVTPTTYLLNGVKRRSLLKNGILKEMEIRDTDVGYYEKVTLVNAMLDPGEVIITTDQIVNRA
ncbi:MAG: aminotransferase class IV [Bacteroidetes bacterium]|nr:aminotransferase class IV [Bacteroidota bacterium]MDA1120560.1 aminotransferase class IV [Bacteroidota bacterium]